MAHRDLIVIGASAGGLGAINTIVAGLPPRLAACVLIVVHTSSDGNGLLPQIVGRKSSLPVAFARDGAVTKRGHVFVARPDCHLMVTRRGMRVTHGPRENGFRPAIDPLFRSAARARGARVVGVILSGALDDGAYGLSVIKRHGGAAVVQDPEDAEIPAMPRNALRETDVDAVLPASAIAAALVALCAEPARGGKKTMARRRKEPESQLPSEDTEVAEMEELFGPPSGLTCPDCGGALWEIEDGNLVRYKCHVGHQYAPDSLLAGQRDVVDGALWSAVRILEEHAELRERMSRRAESAGLHTMSAAFAERAENSHRQAQQIRSLLFAEGGGSSAALVAERAALEKTAKGKTDNNRARTNNGVRPSTRGGRTTKKARRSRARKPPR